MQVKSIPLDSIKVENRYRSDKGDIEGLAETIKEHGLIQPISVDQNFRLLAGERRYLAHKHLGMLTIDAVIHEVIGKIAPLEIELIENAERKDMTWPERAKLERDIFELKIKSNPRWSQAKQAEFRNTVPSQISRRMQLAEALELLPDLADHATEDEAWKIYKRLEEDYVSQELHNRMAEKPEIAQASKWAKDHYKIGDTLEQMAKLDKEKAHFAEVDPPYGVALDRRKGRNKDDSAMDTYNEIPGDEYVAFLEKVAAEVFRLLKPNSFAVFWYGMSWHNETLSTLRKVGFGVPDIPAVWTKGNVGQTAQPDTTLGSCYEPFFLCRKGKPKLVIPGRGNVFAFSTVTPSRKIHATEKPIELLDEILRICCWPGSAILIPFLGSGVTLRAAYKGGHTGWGYDLDEENKRKFLQRVVEDQANGQK